MIELPRVCDPETFLAGDPSERRRWVAKQIRNHPEHHNQGMWFGADLHSSEDATSCALRRTGECGTTACVAGWACLLAGLTPVDSFEAMDGWRRIRPAGDIARELLGYDKGQPDDLFSAAALRDEVLEILES